MLHLKVFRQVCLCHVRKQEPTEEDPRQWIREGTFMLQPGRLYPMVEVKNPFDPDGGAPWLAIADPAKHITCEEMVPGDMFGLNKYSLVHAQRSICHLEEIGVPQQPALLQTRH